MYSLLQFWFPNMIKKRQLLLFHLVDITLQYVLVKAMIPELHQMIKFRVIQMIKLFLYRIIKYKTQPNINAANV